MKKNKFERKKEKWTSKEKFLMVLPVVAALLGSLMTYSFSLITARNQKEFAIQQKQSEIEQKQLELQKAIYTKIVASGATYAQSITVFLYNRINTHWNDGNFKLFHKKNDLSRHEKGLDLEFELLTNMTDARKEFLENLALAQTCFKMDLELQNAIDKLLRFPIVDIENPDRIKSKKELQNYYDAKELELKKNVDSFDFSLFNLTEILKKRLSICS